MRRFGIRERVRGVLGILETGVSEVRSLGGSHRTGWSVAGGLEGSSRRIFTVAAEPFYGFLNDLDENSREHDVLMLFINPGHVDHPAKLASRWLNFHRRRYIEWTREDYLRECGVQDRPGEVRHQEPCTCPIGELYEKPGVGCQWRRQRFGQARNNVGWGQLRFLHTMEYSFYHSDKWSDLAPFHRWIRESPTTQLAMGALREIAQKKLVSRIITIGKDWRDVLSREPE